MYFRVECRVDECWAEGIGFEVEVGGVFGEGEKRGFRATFYEPEMCCQYAW